MVGPWHHVLDSGTIKADNMEQPISQKSCKQISDKYEQTQHINLSEQCGIDLLLVSNFSRAIHFLTVDKTQCVAPDISN